MAADVGNALHVDSRVRDDLQSIYADVMWVAKRSGVTPSDARAWYTHKRSARFRLIVRRVSGNVSERAAREKEGPLGLQPYKRMPTTLAKLVERHLATKKRNPDEFVDVVLTLERVHVVTIAENYSATRAKGNYRKAGIKLVAWRSLSENRRTVLWRNLLRGKIANAGLFSRRCAK